MFGAYRKAEKQNIDLFGFFFACQIIWKNWMIRWYKDLTTAVDVYISQGHFLLYGDYVGAPQWGPLKLEFRSQNLRSDMTEKVWKVPGPPNWSDLLSTNWSDLVSIAPCCYDDQYY